MVFDVTFLGVRGSTPCAGPLYEKYGGHTSCVLVRVRGELLIFDAGSGIVDVKIGDAQKAHLFFSHLHLDHVMGLPFFKPVWNKDFFLNFYSRGLGLEAYLENMFSPPLFPVPFKDFPVQKKFIDIDHKHSLSKDITIETSALNHPNGATGYKILCEGKSICYITDTEHTEHGLDENILDLIQGTDLFIYDASYTDETYPAYKGWGHSTWQEAHRLAQKANVKKTVLFHHDPNHTDDKMDEIKRLVDPLGMIVSRQGMKISV